MERKEVVYLIYDVIDKVNELLPDEQKLTKSENTKLYGTDGQLDSLGTVNFIVALEHKIEQSLGASLSLVNETTMSELNSPFQTVFSLAEYISHLLNESNSC
tara:strand:+ start:1257 stop:1562 length:306 start_codon:yes stop_codon:yes gene_type:complete